MKPTVHDDSRKSLDPEGWVQEHGDALYRYAYSILKDKERSEDAVQETFLAALRARDRFGEHSSVQSWLFGILKHKIVDIIRQDSRYVRPGDFGDTENDPDFEDRFFDANGRWETPPRTWEHPERSLENREFWQDLEQCLARLPPKTVRIFFLREMEGMSTEEICQEIGGTPTNIWKVLSRARMKLRECLERHGFGKG